jgi:hypothetical protein
MSDEECTESTTDCEGGDKGSPVAGQIKANPWIIIVALLLGLGTGGGVSTGLTTALGHGGDQDCRDMVLRLELSDDQVKALSPRQGDENLATKIETALLDQQIKTLREQVSEMRSERRPGRRQSPD